MAWLPGYSKRKKITLTGGSSGAQTNYQLKLTVAYDSDMKANFDDLRFTKADGTTLIDAWLESKTDSTSAVVWVEFPTTPANTVTEDYYMYYGNSGATSYWDGDNTFEFFDDFATDSIGTKWTVDDEPTHFSIADGVLKINASAQQNVIRTNTYSASDYIIEMKWKFTYHQSGSRTGVLGRYTDLNNFYNVWIADSSFTGSAKGMVCGRKVSGSWSESLDYSNFNWSLDTWYDVGFVVEGTNLKGYFEDDLKSSQSYTNHSSGKVGIRSYYDDLEIDDFRVRKYAANPSTYVFGSEETVGVGSRLPRALFGPLRGALGGF